MSGFRLSRRAKSGMLRGRRPLARRSDYPWSLIRRFSVEEIAAFFGVPASVVAAYPDHGVFER